jgi:hypothetical protein
VGKKEQKMFLAGLKEIDHIKMNPEKIFLKDF